MYQAFGLSKYGLPKSQFHSLCHFDEDFIEKAAAMKERFVDRGYSVQCVEEAFQAAFSKPRSDLLQKSVKKDKSVCLLHYCIYSSGPYPEEHRS